MSDRAPNCQSPNGQCDVSGEPGKQRMKLVEYCYVEEVRKLYLLRVPESATIEQIEDYFCNINGHDLAPSHSHDYECTPKIVRYNFPPKDLNIVELDNDQWVF